MNVTIDRYVYASIEWNDGNEVVIESHDLSATARHAAGQAIPFDGNLDIVKAVYNRVARDFMNGQFAPLSISTYSEAPAGSGLGSSSALVVAVLQAFTELLGLPLGEYDVAHLAFEIERNDLGFHGGRQDQYAATFGGFNFMEFHDADTVIVNPLRVKTEVTNELESQTLLCFSGISRESAGIIERQSANVRSGSTRSIEAMHRLKESAVAMKRAILKGDINGVAEALNVGWISKRDMAEGIVTETIESAMSVALQAGATAGKISGAGGGGFIMFLVPIRKRRNVITSLSEHGFRTEGCRFTNDGAMAWRV